MASYMVSSGHAWKGASFSTNALAKFPARHSSADRDIAEDIDVLRCRSRYLFQNSPFCRALILSFCTNVIGTGLKARPTLKQYEMLGLTEDEAKKWESKTRDLFLLWSNSKKCDAEKKNNFCQLQKLAFKESLVAGDCFALPCFSKNIEPFGLEIKVLPAERCQNPFGRFDSDSLAQGVEVTEKGSPKIYHFTNKPTWSIDNYTDCVDSVPVYAFDGLGTPNVLHVFSSDRCDQRRGIPILASVINPTRNLEGYQDSETLAAKVSANFTAVIENNEEEEAEDLYGNAGGDESGSSVQPEQVGSEQILEMGPGAVWSLAKGQKLQSLNPQRPNVNYKPFVDSIYCECAASCGNSFELVLHSFGGANYNAVRASLHESKKTFDSMRKDFVSDFCQPVYEKWLTQAVLLGIVDAPGFFDNPVKRALWCGCRWIADASFLLDPLKETQALKMQIDEQLVSRDDACSMVNGGEYDAVIDELADELRKRKERGLGEPGSVTKTESFTVTSDDTEESSLN